MGRACGPTYRKTRSATARCTSPMPPGALPTSSKARRGSARSSSSILARSAVMTLLYPIVQQRYDLLHDGGPWGLRRRLGGPPVGRRLLGGLGARLDRPVAVVGHQRRALLDQLAVLDLPQPLSREAGVGVLAVAERHQAGPLELARL